MRIVERLAKPSGTSSFVSQRIYLLTSRIFAVALIVSLYEAGTQAFAQRQYIQPVWFWLTLGWLAASLIYALIESFIFNRGRLGLAIHALGVIFTLLTWQWQLATEDLPADFRPWIWWQLGIGALCAGLAMRPALGWPLMFGLPFYWYFFRQQPYSGGPDPMVGFQDSIYSVLFAAIVVSMVNLLTIFAKRADRASELAREAQVSQARADAVERAKRESDSEVHSKILATLEAAYNAEPNAEHPAIVQSATSALESLREFATSYSVNSETTSARNFFDALASTAQRQFDGLEVHFRGSGELTISFEVANALSDATMQALDNSYRHAGGKKVSRKLHLKAKPKSVKIVVEDDGRGFRPSHVSKDRLGVRKTIRGRVEAIGGVVKLDSEPGQGCRVVLEWTAE